MTQQMKSKAQTENTDNKLKMTPLEIINNNG